MNKEKIKEFLEKARVRYERTGSYRRVPGDYYHEVVVSELVEMIRLDERDRITQLLYQMHERAVGHTYYRHAVIEINRPEGEKL